MADFEIKIMNRCEEIKRCIDNINISQFEANEYDFLVTLNESLDYLRSEIHYFYNLMSAHYRFENLKGEL